MKKLLTLKHWQLFALLIGFPVLFKIAFIFLIFLTNSQGLFFVFFPALMILVIALYFSWFYTLGINLHEKLPEDVYMNVQKFKIAMAIPVFYFFCFFFFFTIAMNQLPDTDTIGPQSMIIIFPLHLLSMFCMFYTIYFIAKSLKSIEMRANLKFADFAGEFFLIWFFPIGIWFLQPRINKIFAEEYDESGYLDKFI